MLQPLFLLLASLFLGGGGLTILGGGSTGASDLLKTWGLSFKILKPQRSLVVERVGSEKGLEGILDGSFSWGVSESFVQDDSVATFPLVAWPVCIVYNIPGISAEGLKLTRENLVDIFRGDLLWWNDTRLSELNPLLAGFPERMTVVARRDGSGTTSTLSQALSFFSSNWTEGVFSSWPNRSHLVDSGSWVFQSGSTGVGSRLRVLDFSLGYVGCSFASRFDLSVADLRNRAGNFVSFRNISDEFQSALDGGSLSDSPGFSDWPIIAETFLLLPKNQTDCDEVVEATRFFHWAVTSHSLRFGANELGFLNLNPESQTVVVAQLRNFECSTSKALKLTVMGFGGEVNQIF